MSEFGKKMYDLKTSAPTTPWQALAKEHGEGRTFTYCCEAARRYALKEGAPWPLVKPDVQARAKRGKAQPKAKRVKVRKPKNQAQRDADAQAKKHPTIPDPRQIDLEDLVVKGIRHHDDERVVKRILETPAEVYPVQSDKTTVTSVKQPPAFEPPADRVPAPKTPYYGTRNVPPSEIARRAQEAQRRAAATALPANPQKPASEAYKASSEYVRKVYERADDRIKAIARRELGRKPTTRELMHYAAREGDVEVKRVREELDKDQGPWPGPRGGIASQYRRK